ncbi:quinone-dependent dihydroorotate dehydrogenase [bacterium]|nr:quinone-dependent dihydroorotate dehydrogenase [bacterium]
MYTLIKNLLFLLPAEKAHYLTMRLFRWFIALPGTERLFEIESKPFTKDGLTFRNKVGLAAGFDKDGKFLQQIDYLDFGFMEIGTVTPKPQSGNPKPRLFRLPQDHALINRMGFNNDGVNALIKRLSKYRKNNRASNMLIGINIGKNKLTPNNEAVNDYTFCYKKLYDLGDFFVVNVSSPNTPGLRELQNKDELRKIISALLEIRSHMDRQKPLYLKIAPDLNEGQLDEIISLQEELQFEGIVATNTSIDRDTLEFTKARKVNDIGDGGLSGRPILEASNRFVQHIRSKSNMTIIGVGGIEDAEGGKSKFDAGADLIEIYTGFIYSGPGIVKKLVQMSEAQA